MKDLSKYTAYNTEALMFRDISLRKGIPNGFFAIMHDLYSPFLYDGHLDNPYQFSVYQMGKRIGFVQIGKAPHFFFQIALIPDIAKQGIGETVVELIKRRFNFPQLGWVFKKNNYPSGKLLYNLGGGIAMEEDDKYIGVLRFRDVYDEGNKRLGLLLPEIQTRYIDWVNNEYSKRQTLKTDLENYLKHTSGEAPLI